MERCPSCSGAVRPGDPWCTLCWTDLRPKPAPPPPVAAAPVAPVAAPAAPVAQVGLVDPLTAPLPVLLGEAPAPVAVAALAAVSWPCVECGNANSIDLDTCSVCTAPFGGRIRRLHDPKAARRRSMLVSLGVVGLFLMLLAAVTFASTNTSSVDPGSGGGEPAPEIEIDYSTLPEG